MSLGALEPVEFMGDGGTGDLCVDECQTQNRQLSRVQTKDALLSGGGLNTYEGPEINAHPSGQKKAVRHEAPGDD